ncbi:GntR family transcriptional regulator [Bosea sp. (in: a-proteobacteria)]|uniref:GntR family transcriptional regulator n=1 Tax=Bosea sp. (in: a-proteobacteria) TaxID=1871050 RepID=UPI003B3B952A
MKAGVEAEAVAESRSQAERAYLRLRGEILHGDLMPGERLRANDLQDRYSLGLTPIREALMRLSSEGFVAAATHRGSRVSELSPHEFADLMATRREIERLCLVKAIALGDAAWEAEIVAAMHMLSRAPLPASPEDREAAAFWEAQHRRFHLALVGACGSDWLLRFWSVLADHSERYRKLRLLRRHEAGAEVRDVNSEHVAIMDSVLARDADKACSLMDAHLAATETSVLRLLREGTERKEEPR